MPSENKTPNIGLNQWLGNEYVKRQDFVDDNKIIDEAYGELKREIENKASDAKGTSFDNSTNGMAATNVQDAIDEVDKKAKNALDKASTNEKSILGIKGSVKSVVNSASETDIASSKAVKIAYDKGTEALSKANEAFQNANNGKNIVATAIGSPLSSADTFATMGSKIDTLTLTFRNNLIDKGVDVSSSDKMATLVDKINDIYVATVKAGEGIIFYEKVLTTNGGDSTNSGSYVTFNEASYVAKLEGSYRVKYRVRVTLEGNTKLHHRVVLIRNGEILWTSTETWTSDESLITYTRDVPNVKKGDTIAIQGKREGSIGTTILNDRYFMSDLVL